MEALEVAYLMPDHYPDLESVEYPFILKKRTGEGGRGVYVIDDKESLEKLGDINFEEYIAEECILDQMEYAVHFFRRDDGRIPYCKTTVYVYPEGSFVKGQDKHASQYPSFEFKFKEEITLVLKKMNYT